jgi:outer membrane protein assembly factor BamB
MRVRTIVIAVALAAAVGSPAPAADWPHFRGPDNDGTSSETGLLESWPEGGPNVLWKKDLGGGFSGISVSDGQLYTMFDLEQETFVASFDAATGEQVWRFGAGKAWKDRQGDGPRSTPTVDGDTVYAVTATGMLYALSSDEGIVRWERNLKDEYGAKIPQWGMSTSPVVAGGFLLLEVGGTNALMVALNKKNGREVWRAGSGKAGYSTPVVIDVNGVTQAVFFTAKAIYSVALKTGEIYWEQPWKTSWDVNAAMPVFIAPDLLFVSSGYDTGSAMLRIEAGDESVKAEEVWRNRDMKNQFSTSIYHDGYLYGFDNKILKCIDAKTGETKWRERDLGHGSLIYADGHLVVMGEKGQLVLVEATPEAFKSRGRMQLFEGKTWTAPSLSDGKLYLRDEHHLVALDVSG